MTEITDVTRLFRELAPNFDLEMGKKKQAKGQAKKKPNEQKEVIPFNERLSALTVCYWNTSIGYLGVERHQDRRPAGCRVLETHHFNKRVGFQSVHHSLAGG